MNRIYLYSLLGALLAGHGSFAQGMKIMPGTTFKLTGGTYDLVLADGAHFENNGPVETGNLVLKASGGGSSEIRGSGTLSVAQVQLNKTAGQTVVLQKNLSVAQGVYFNSGLLNLNGFDLVLADTALLVNESNASRITGNAGAVQITRNLDAPLAENPGNLGLIITSGANWGNTQVRRSHQNNTNPGGGNSLSRNFQVTPANNSGLNAFLRMYYLDAELNGLDENTLEYFRSDDGGLLWSSIGAAGRNTTQNFVNINGLQTMARFTLSTIGNPLPLAFTGIQANCAANRVRLEWQYDHAMPGAYFRVDKSRDGAVWHATAAHVKTELSTAYRYSFTDDTEPYPYYRLSYVNTAHVVVYAPVTEVNCRESGYAFNLLQNPVGSQARIWIQAKIATALSVRVYDMQGRMLLERPSEVINAGVSYVNIDVAGLAGGMYLLQLGNANGLLWQTKFVK